MANGSAAKVSSTKPKSEGIFSRMGKFIRESFNETYHKSAWPTWPELKQFTLIVIFALLVVSIWVGGIDFVLTRLTERIAGARLGG